MDTLAFPILWVGPAGSGKLTAARHLLGAEGRQPRLQTLEVGDYSARYWEFPTHMEVDIMDLSMMDKQILPEILTQLLSTRDVLRSQRKIMILRRVHGLSPPAAQRLRTCLEELVWSSGAPAMVWCTARVVNSVVSHIADGFVYKRVPGTLISPLRKQLAAAVGVNAEDVPTIQSYVRDVIFQMIKARAAGPPCLEVAQWIRARVYDLLGLMITGSELVMSLVWATVQLAAAGELDGMRAKKVLGVLTRIRWIPSYRTPLILELTIMEVYNALSDNVN